MYMEYVELCNDYPVPWDEHAMKGQYIWNTHEHMKKYLGGVYITMYVWCI